MLKTPSLAAYVETAQQALPKSIWQYLEDAAGKAYTKQHNTLAWQRYLLAPRPLQPIREASTACQMFEEQWAHPIMLAPIAYQMLFHSDGEQASAMATNAQDGQMMVSSLASQTLESVIETAEQPLWFQLYWQGDRKTTLDLVNRAIQAGYSVIVFTVDAPVKQAVMALPEHIHAVNLIKPLTPNTIKSGQSLIFDGWMAQAPTWEDVVWLRDNINIPLILKGILAVEDAMRAVKVGCDAIVISNHGGRVLDTTPTSAEVLPDIAKALNHQCKILVDGGIRSGQDVFKAIALGADAVCIGRPYIYALASEGAMGVARVIRTMRDELEMTMALTGCSTDADIKQYPQLARSNYSISLYEGNSCI